MKKHKHTFGLDDRTSERLDQLSEKLMMNRTDAVVYIINKKYDQVFPEG